MYYTIDAVQPTGVLTIDTFDDTVGYLEAFTVWEDIVTEANDGFEIDMGRRGYLALRAGDRVRLIQWSDGDGAGEGTVVDIETISADANKRRTN